MEVEWGDILVFNKTIPLSTHSVSEWLTRMHLNEVGDMSYRWWSSCRTNVGRIRQVNEDAFLDRGNMGLWLVADGMGGHARGDVASKLIIEAFDDLRPATSLSEFAVEVRARLKSAHQSVKGESYRGGGRQIMGSTVVALLVFKGRWLCMWAGDSRAYLLRESRFIQVTKDHSIAQELVDLGKLDKNEMDTHPYANHITRAIGANPELILDERSSKLHDGDVFLLCSDGLTKELPEKEIARVIQSYDSDLATQELIDLSLEHGGRDNITVALVNFEETTGFSEPAKDDTAINYEIVRNNLGASSRDERHVLRESPYLMDHLYLRSE